MLGQRFLQERANSLFTCRFCSTKPCPKHQERLEDSLHRAADAPAGVRRLRAVSALSTGYCLLLALLTLTLFVNALHRVPGGACSCVRPSAAAAWWSELRCVFAKTKPSELKASTVLERMRHRQGLHACEVGPWFRPRESRATRLQACASSWTALCAIAYNEGQSAPLCKMCKRALLFSLSI